MHNTFYTGIVESREDPLKLGRCQVRISGLHTDNKNNIPTKELQWAIPLNSVNSASMNGIGFSPTGLVEGSMVLIIFTDEYKQHPIILGSICGIQNDKVIDSKGFKDPDGKYPLDEYVGESDVNRLAREETSGTIIDIKEKNRITGVPISMGGSWDEPISFGAKYPYNNVIETESGHVIELDDSPNNERINIFHRSGTYTETNANGTQTNHIIGDSFHITENNGSIYVKGNCNITVDGDINLKGNSNMNVEIANDLNMSIGGNYNLRIGGDYVIESSSYNYKTGEYKLETGNAIWDYSFLDLGVSSSPKSVAFSGMNEVMFIEVPELIITGDGTFIKKEVDDA